MEGDNFLIVNWKIENLSCWNKALLGESFESPRICFNPVNFQMKLYPRGTSGLEEHMLVHLSTINRVKEFCGDFSFIDADGSTLCTQRVLSIKDKNDLELSPGPKFEEVTKQSKGNEADRKDELILRLQIKSDYRYDEIHLCTIIQVFDVTMEVDRSVILKENEHISYIRYIYDDYDTDLYLKIGKIREDKKIELYLYSDAGNDQFLVKTYLSLISSEGSLLSYENNEQLFQEETKWKFSDSLSKGELSQNIRLFLNFKIISGEVSYTLRNVYFSFDGVKIISNRYASVCMENIPNENKTESAIAHNDQENAVGVLSKELMCLYQDQDFSDLQLKCQSVSFPVHRNILSARSTVFKTMLSSEMTEAATGCVDIKDLEAPTLARFLAFLYTGTLEDLQVESALKLYYAADKYHIPSLMRECVSFLSANICVSNVCDVLSLGDKHKNDELVAAAHTFILRNFNIVLKSKEWKSFMCSEPFLALKTVTDFAHKDLFRNFNPL